MSIPRIIRLAFVALCSFGLGVPAFALGDCCCQRKAEKNASPEAKSCCQAEEHSEPGLSESECTVRQTCQFCQVPTVVVSEMHKRSFTPPAALPPASITWDVPVSEPLASLIPARNPSLPHNVRLSQISVWRK